MISHLAVKFGLMFLGGALFTLGVLQIFSMRGDILISGREGLKEKVAKEQERIEKKVKRDTGDVAGSFTEGVWDRVVEQVSKNPALEPLFKAKSDVENTYNTLRALPNEQRNAVCQQICSE